MTEEEQVNTDQADIQGPPKKKQISSEKLAEKLHDRARESSQQLHKLLLSFSTGLLAVFFVALTATEDAAKPGVQTISAIAGLSAMGIAVLTGLFAYYADMKRNYFRASALQAKDKLRRDELFQTRDQWRRCQRLSILALNSFFLFGIISSLLYVISRVLDY
ncbi:MAG TPA: hypothetical protein VMW72_25825 [Sedimentisphaerales bacterium]|nr:hypothetical protein [Sedimentisphaerales bacterium]